MTNLNVYYKRYYIAIQDGRLDNEEYNSHTEAENAWKELPDFIKKSSCIKSYYTDKGRVKLC